MTEPKTYYGPWLESVPTDAPNGSLWQAMTRSGNTVMYACALGRIIDEEGRCMSLAYVSRSWAQQSGKIRRVWPPGSVLPEPRPLVVNGDLRADDDCHWMVKLSPLSPWICFDSLDLDYEMTDDLSRAVCYPVQPLNGAFVPVPWPDSGCTTE